MKQLLQFEVMYWWSMAALLDFVFRFVDFKSFLFKHEFRSVLKNKKNMRV